MDNILLIVPKGCYRKTNLIEKNKQEDSKQDKCKSFNARMDLILDKIFYKKRILRLIRESLIRIDLSNTNSTKNINDNCQDIFLVKVPYKYMEQELYGKAGIEKSYNAKILAIQTINAICAEKDIKNHFYSKDLLELYQIEFREKLSTQITAYEKFLEGKHKYRTRINKNPKIQVEYYEDQVEPINLGKTLFRSLTLEILKKISEYKQTDLIDMNIAIAGNEENKADIYKMLWKLPLLVKYITILVTSEKTLWLEHEIENIYNSTGLAVNVVSNYKSVLPNIDILINYGNLFDLNEYKQLKRNIIIINNSLNDYNNQDRSRILRNPVVNGIEINMPEQFHKGLASLAPEHFNNNQLIDILLGIKCKWDESKIEKSFKEEGFIIGGLIGLNIDLAKLHPN